MSGLSLEERLRLQIAFGAGSSKLLKYLAEGHERECYYRLLHDDQFADDPQVKAFRRLNDIQINGVINNCQRNGIQIVTPDDDDFPDGMRQIDDPPLLIFAVGDIKRVNEMRAAAIVGTRRACDYSLAVTENFAYRLAGKYGINVVSGFALGIDSAAHRGAMSAGGFTTAVLGGGILYEYPKNSSAFRKAVAEHGVVISEYLPNAQPYKDSFKVRNRLLTGIADCVLVVEAGRPSGSLNSAYHAADQGKDVFVIPPFDVLSDRCAGQMQLLYEGAELAMTPEDIYLHIVDRYKFS